MTCDSWEDMNCTSDRNSSMRPPMIIGNYWVNYGKPLKLIKTDQSLNNKYTHTPVIQHSDGTTWPI